MCRRSGIVVFAFLAFISTFLAACNEDSSESLPWWQPNTTLPPCANGDSKAWTDDSAVLSQWKDTCYGIRGREDDFKEGYCDNGCQLCGPVTIYMDEETATVFCEQGNVGAGAMDAVSKITPSLGFPEFTGSDSLEIPTGWYDLKSGFENLKTLTFYELDQGTEWSSDTLDSIVDRSPSSTVCETITDLETCIGTHNSPYHCMPVFRWPIYHEGETCSVELDEETIEDRMDDIGFLACRTVAEPAQNPLNSWPDYNGEEILGAAPTYKGPLKNTATGECVGFEDFEFAIPDGWAKANCSECSE